MVTERHPVPSFDDLYREYAGFVYNVAYRMTGARADAEDVVQEAFLRVFRFLPQYRGGSLKSWLYRIVMNVFLSGAERKKRDRAVPLEGHPEQGGGLEAFLADSSGDPGRLVEQYLLEERLQRALLKLPVEYRAAMVLRDLEGLTYEEMAETLGVPLGTVRSRLSRARHMMKTLLSKGQTYAV